MRRLDSSYFWYRISRLYSFDSQDNVPQSSLWTYYWFRYMDEQLNSRLIRNELRRERSSISILEGIIRRSSSTNPKFVPTSGVLLAVVSSSPFSSRSQSSY